MNKDMINIDDFVREKLGSREEKEDPAAWLRMQALLDKEMPEKAIPIGFRFGRSAVYLGCALLAALLSVGGYKLLNTNTTPNAATLNGNGHPALSNTSGTAKEISNIIGRGPAADNNSSSGANINNSNTAHPAANNVNTAAVNSTNNNNSATAGKQEIPANSTAGTAAHQNRHNQQLSVSSALNNKHNNKTKESTQVPIADKHNASQHSQATTATAAAVNKTTNTYNSGIVTGNSISNKNNNSPLAATTTANSGKSSSGADHKKDNSKASVTANAAAGKTNTAPSTLTNNNSTTAPVKQAQTPENETLAAKEQGTKDSMNALGLIKHATTTGTLPRKTVYTIDSLDLGKVAVSTDAATVPGQAIADPATEKRSTKNTAANNYGNPRYLGANPPQQPMIAATAPNPVPESSTAGTTTSAAEQLKKKQKRDYLAFLKNIDMEEIIDNVKYDVGHAQFYLGATGGFNSSLGAQRFRGPQFGVSGELVFNKHLSLMGELKYFNRSGGNKTVDDSYTKEHHSSTPDSVIGSNYYYTVLTDSTRRYFNFSTLHSFELPVTLRYAFNKFYLMTGINVGYYLGLNVEEINDYSRVNTNPTVVNTVLSKGPEVHEGQPKININDFGSRYAIGYIFGAGYQISPALQTDLRIISTFWDNAQTVGAKQISRDFYRIPSLQISINYQFSREKRKASFGPEHR